MRIPDGYTLCTLRMKNKLEGLKFQQNSRVKNSDSLINSMKATLFNQCNFPAKFDVSRFFEISGYRTRVTIVQFLNFQTFNNHVN